MSHLGWANCPQLPPGNWLMRTTNLFLGPQVPLCAHVHSTPSNLGSVKERARGKPGPMEKWQDLNFARSGSWHLLGVGHIS